MTPEAKNMLIAEYKKNTRGCDDAGQIKEYKHRLIAMNRNWNGNPRLMNRPGMQLETEEDRVLNKWMSVFHPAYGTKISRGITRALKNG